MLIPDHVGDLQVFVIDRVVLTHQLERRLVVKVGSLAAYRLMRPCQYSHRLAPAMAAFLAPTHPALRGFERAFRLAIPARREDAHAVRQGSEGFQPQVYTCSLPG